MKQLVIVLLISLLLVTLCLGLDDYESITVSSTAIGFTASKIHPTANEYTKEAMCTLEMNQIRFRIDGTDPTSSEGHLMSPNESITLKDYNSINKFKAIRVSADATLKCTYYITKR